MNDRQKPKAPRERSSETAPTKRMERTGTKVHPGNEMTQDRYEEGSNSETAGLHADPGSDADAADLRDSDRIKPVPKTDSKKAEDPPDEGQPGFRSMESDEI